MAVPSYEIFIILIRNEEQMNKTSRFRCKIKKASNAWLKARLASHINTVTLQIAIILVYFRLEIVVERDLAETLIQTNNTHYYT